MFDLSPSSSCLLYFADHHVLVHSIQALAMTVSPYLSSVQRLYIIAVDSRVKSFQAFNISLMNIILQQQDALMI